jgi:hypothetical protein
MQCERLKEAALHFFCALLLQAEGSMLIFLCMNVDDCLQTRWHWGERMQREPRFSWDKNQRGFMSRIRCWIVNRTVPV